jgi:predicted nucleic acid-binding protein
VIIDASVILRAFFPDEAQEQAQCLIRDHVAGQLTLEAPSLLPYELCNAIWEAERRGRINREQADEILQAVEDLNIQIQHLDWKDLLPLARQYRRTAFDAAYLALAQTSQQPLVTGDERLYNAVHEHLDWVIWIEDYRDEA